MSDRQKALDKAVLGLFQEYASTFLTTLYCSLKFSWDDTIPTACTNGIFLKINPTWFLTLSEKMRVTLLAHELWHVAYMHMMRLGDRKPRRWNEAGDIAINNTLEDNGYHFDLIVGGPYAGQKMGRIDHQYDGMSAEQIYDELEQSATEINLPFGEDFTGEGQETGDGDGSGGSPPLTPEEQQQVIANVVKATTVSQMNSREAGKLPGDFTEMMDRLLHPKLPWNALLSRWLTERSEEGYNWRIPNRRYAHEGLYLPSPGGQEGLAHLLWALDASGSVTRDQLQIFNSEIKGAKEAHNPQHMTLVTFDTRIQDTWEISHEDELKPLSITGRGGTDMSELFEMARKTRPDAMVVLSDMCCAIPDQVPGVPVLWLCYDNDSWSPPYGDVVHVCSTPTIQA